MNPEDGTIIILQSFGNYLPTYTASHPEDLNLVNTAVITSNVAFLCYI